MRKLAVLTGEAGCGKGTIAKQVQKELPGVEILHADPVMHFTVVRLCPFLSPGRAYDWNVWKWLLVNCDVAAAFSQTMQERLAGPLASSSPILAEATLLGLPALRAAFEKALRGASELESRLFWLDVSAEVLHERILQRGRANELAFGIDEYRGRLAHFNPHLEGADAFRSSDSESVRAELTKYLRME
jgi:predicted kinase